MSNLQYKQRVQSAFVNYCSLNDLIKSQGGGKPIPKREI